MSQIEVSPGEPSQVSPGKPGWAPAEATRGTHPSPGEEITALSPVASPVSRGGAPLGLGGVLIRVSFGEMGVLQGRSVIEDQIRGAFGPTSSKFLLYLAWEGKWQPSQRQRGEDDTNLWLSH